MDLYLVQHGEAVSKESNPNRPLTSAGREKAGKTAAFIAAHAGIEIKRIIHSGKERALETAQIFADHLHIDEVEEGKELNPQSAPWSWVERLSATGENLMIVGHLPFLKRLAALLICQDETKPCVEFHMGGVVGLRRNESGLWSVIWIVTPEVLP